VMSLLLQYHQRIHHPWQRLLLHWKPKQSWRSYNIIFSIPVLAFSGPIIRALQLYLTSGVNANGSRRPKSALTTLTSWFNLSGKIAAIITAGVIAVSLVTILRIQGETRILR
jgi:hypothetical protein